MITLKNGHVVLAYNHNNSRERTPLNIALSMDEARSWRATRVLESGKGPFSYPSLCQTGDGHVHVTYTYRRQFIKHVELNEAWILEDSD
jgi:alpha-L-rhamnosidase